MLIVSTIRLMFDLSVSCVPRPCLYMLGSSSQPKCIACVNLAYTRCIRTLESITPDHHVVLRNNKLSQRCTVRGNTSWIYCEGSSYLSYRRSKQISVKHDKHHMQSNSDMIWPISYSSFDLHLGAPWSSCHRLDTMISIIMISIIVSPWSCSPTITSTTTANGLAIK